MPTLPRLHKDEKSPAHHKITYLQACKLDLKESNMYLALCRIGLSTLLDSSRVLYYDFGPGRIEPPLCPPG